MRLPDKSSAPDVFHRLALAHTATLQADPQTQDLVAPMQTVDEQLTAAAGRRAKAREQTVMKLALRERADYEADRLVRQIDGEALVASGRDRNKAPYRTLFPNGVTPVVVAPLAQEVQLLKTLEERLASAGDLARLVDALKTARTTLEGAMTAYAEAARAEAIAGGDVEVAKEDWLRQYQANYGALLARLGNKAQAESYFLSQRRRAKGDEEGGGEGDEGA